MKTEEELLKIYSAYLPYNLKGKKTDGAKGDYILRAVYNDGSLIWKYDGFGNSTQIGVLPVLYSIEMLTQEIEHNGDRFVPLEIIGQMIDKDYKGLSEDGNGAIIGKDVNPSCACPYECDCEVTSYNLFYNTLNFYSTVYVDGDQDNFVEEVVHESYLLVQKLLEWHFNVFGLEESEYFKKETLNRSENPNS